MEPPPRLERELRRALALLPGVKEARIFCHRDADGLCGGAIALHLLRSRGIETRVSVHLPDEVGSLRPVDGLNLFVDMGSGQLSELRDGFHGEATIILDHHRPQGRAWKGLVEINPNKYGLKGSEEVSGAGIAYLLSELVDGRVNAKLAVVGAVADRQNLLGEFIGLNRRILRDAEEEGRVREEKDVLLFGRESRPLHIALKSFSDPPVPGVSGSETGAMQLLSDLGIPLRDGKGPRTLGSLTLEERRRLASELVVRCITRTSPGVARFIPRLIIGSVYRLVGERPPLQYASEYATVANSAARMGLSSDALEMMLDGSGQGQRRVMAGLREYRKAVSRGVRMITGTGITLGGDGYLQYFISPEIPRNILGPITGLVLGSGLADPYKPLVGMVPGIRTKASARCSRVLVLEGLDMGRSIQTAAEDVGGTGGGHPGAAGAVFGSGAEAEFLGALEKCLLAQLQARRSQSA
jgi:RecJ-like exonuclease